MPSIPGSTQYTERSAYNSQSKSHLIDKYRTRADKSLRSQKENFEVEAKFKKAPNFTPAASEKSDFSLPPMRNTRLQNSMALPLVST